MKRIKHNDLLPWFTQDHSTLPASYLASCQEFFNWLDQCNQNGFQAPSSEPQASSNEQVTSKKNYDTIKTESENI